MTALYARNFKVITLCHALLVAALVVVSMWQGWFRREPERLMVEFMIAPRPAEAAEAPEPQTEPEPEPEPLPAPEDIPEPEPEPEPEPKPEPEPPPERKPIKISTNRVRKRLDPPKPVQPTLSEEEWKRRLALGATIGDHTTPVPEEDARCKLLIRRRFYEVWRPPGKAEVGDATVEVTIRFDLSGRILSRHITKLSGIGSLDTSVQTAIEAVQRIDGLTPGFLRRNPTATITFLVVE